jgi:hypothetical protein
LSTSEVNRNVVIVSTVRKPCTAAAFLRAPAPPAATAADSAMPASWKHTTHQE